MASKSSLRGEEGRVDWPQIVLVILAIIGLTIAASLAAGFAGEQTPGEDLLDGLGEEGEPSPAGPSPEDGGFEEPPAEETENGDEPASDDNGEQADEEAHGDGDDWHEEDSIIAAEDETGIDHGEFSEPSEQVVFEVYTEEPAYWRITAYDSYTGQSWERSDEIQRVKEVKASEHRHDLIQEIVPKAETHAVPAAWQAVDFGGIDQEPYFDRMNGLRVDEPVEPVESGQAMFGVLSILPVTDEGMLNEAGTNYPEHIESHYLQQPAEVPDRVTEKTDEITAEAETPYEKAAIIAYWLRTNNDYSLDVPPPEGEITDEVLFERDEAYCTYFATAMTNMLRTQDIPARYVTGYGPGEFHDDENRAVVRAMNAHAWVEVYFPGYGWVPFEPTPADDRSDAIEAETEEGEDSLEFGDPTDEASLEETIESIDGLEPGELDESVEFDDEGDTEERNEDKEPDERNDAEQDEEAYDVELPDEIVPGEIITATVTRNDEPVPGATVQFNGDTIGETDEEGNVSGEVPFVEELNVTVIPPGESAAATASIGSAGRLLASPSGADSLNRTVPTDGDFNLTIQGIAIPEKEVPLLVTIENNSIPEAEITIDDEYVGTTDADGSLTLTLPREEDEINVTAERGELAGTTPVELHPIAIEVEDRPIAGTTVSVNVTVSDAPLPDAMVELGNTEVGYTDDTGRTQVPLPDTPGKTTLAVTYSGVYEAHTLEVVALSIDIDERPMSGKSVTVKATAGDEPLDTGRITVDGSQAGETDPNGTRRIRLPETTGSMTVELEYSGHETSTELDVKPLEIEQQDDFSFPLKTSEFEVTWNQEPVSNATIAFDDAEMGTTDGDGLFSARVPITTELVVLADRNGATANTTIEGLLYKIGGVLVLPLVLLGGLSYWQRHRFARPVGYFRGIGHRVVRIVALIPHRGLDLLVQLGRWFDRVRARGLVALADCWEWLCQRLQAMRVMIPRYLARLRNAISSFDLVTLRGVLTALLGWFKRRKTRARSIVRPKDEQRRADSATAAPSRERTITLRVVWDRFVAAVQPPRLRTKTPGEIKRYAVNRGFPPQPVETIVELFRAAEYGKQTPTATDISEAEQALETAQRESEH